MSNRKLEFYDENGVKLDMLIDSNEVWHHPSNSQEDGKTVETKLSELDSAVETLGNRIDGLQPTVVQGDVTIFNNLYDSDEYSEYEDAAISAKQAMLLKDHLESLEETQTALGTTINTKLSGTRTVDYWNSKKFYKDLCQLALDLSTPVDYAVYMETGLVDPRGKPTTSGANKYKCTVISVKEGDTLTFKGTTGKFEVDNTHYVVPIAIFVSFSDWKIYHKIVATTNSDTAEYNETYTIGEGKDGLCFIQMYHSKTSNGIKVPDGEVTIQFAEETISNFNSDCLKLESFSGYSELFNSSVNIDTTEPCQDRIIGDQGGNRPISATERTNAIKRTAFIQRVLYLASLNSTSKVLFPKNGHIYMEPDLLVPGNIELDLNGCTLQCMSNRYSGYQMIHVPSNANNVLIKNGTLLGDRDTHHCSWYNKSGAYANTTKGADEFNYTLCSEGSNFTALNLKVGCVRGDGITVNGDVRWNHVDGVLSKHNFTSISSDKAKYNSRIDLLGPMHTTVIRPDGSFDWDFTPKILVNLKSVASKVSPTYEVVYYETDSSTEVIGTQVLTWGESLEPPTGARFIELIIGIDSNYLTASKNGTSVIEGNEGNANTIDGGGANEDDGEGTGNASTNQGDNSSEDNIPSDSNANVEVIGTFSYGSDKLFPGVWMTLTHIQENSTIKGCEVFDCGRNGITPTGSRKLVIDQCYVHDIYGTCNDVGIDFEASSFVDRDVTVSNTRIERCGMRNSNGDITHGGSIGIATGDFYILDNCDFENLWGGSAGTTIRNCRCKSIGIYTNGTVNNFGSRSRISDCTIRGNVYTDGIVSNCLIFGIAQNAGANKQRSELSRATLPTYENCLIYEGTGIANYHNCKIYKANIVAPAPKDAVNNIITYRDCYVASPIEGDKNSVFTSGYNPSNAWYDVTYPVVNMYNCYVDIIGTFSYLKFNKIIGNRFFDKRKRSTDAAIYSLISGGSNSDGVNALRFADGAVFSDNYIEVASSSYKGYPVLNADISNVNGNITICNNIIDRKVQHTDNKKPEFKLTILPGAVNSTAVNVFFKNNTILKNYTVSGDGANKAYGDIGIHLNGSSADAVQIPNVTLYKEGNTYHDGLVEMPLVESNTKCIYKECLSNSINGIITERTHGIEGSEIIHGGDIGSDSGTPTDIQPQINAINSAINSLQTSVNLNNTEIESMGGRISTNESSIASLNRDIHSTEDNIQKMNRIVSNLNTTVTDVNNFVHNILVQNINLKGDSIAYLELAVFGGVRQLDPDDPELEAYYYAPSTIYSLDNISVSSGIYADYLEEHGEPGEQTIGD